MENLEQIKKAIEVEVKYKYININGKTKTFSSFVCSELRKEIKSSKNPKWQILLEHFQRYSMDTLPQRKKSIDRLVSVIKSDIEQKENTQTDKDKTLTLKSDVMYLKGVGPKLGYLLNKLGIYSISDLLYYFPRKHVDYSSRTRIRDLEIGETTTIFGTIKSVEAFNTKNNLGVLKVRIADGSGSLFLSFFVSKASKYALERMKTQFPKNSGIMVSGTVKLNSYDGQLTLDKPTYSIMDYGTEENIVIVIFVQYTPY
jgi:ATP-dependent DNA helicase RecG